MKFRKFGRVALALAVSLGTGLAVTSCSTDHTTGYLWVTGSQYNQIGSFRIFNNVGTLDASPDQPYASGGVNPIKAVVSDAGRYLYVLNAGCGGTSQTACPAGTSADETGANIALFSIGGNGVLSYQETYTSQGNYPISLATDSSGKYLLVLDTSVPSPSTANCPTYSSTNPASVCGDVTAFSIDPNTGRLSLLTNANVRNSAGTNLTYFPVGSGPINFALYNSTYLYTIETGSGAAADPSQAVFVYAFSESNGQLTTTQNTPIPSNALGTLTYVYASSKYVYLLDTGNSSYPEGEILPYTAGTNGALQALSGGAVANTGTTANPIAMLVEHSGNFLYVANNGPNLTPTSPASTVSAFYITPTSGLLQPLSSGASGNSTNNVPFGSGSGPECILEDPSNQYLYTANYNSADIAGAIIDQAAGTLTNLRKNSYFNTVGEPTWCVDSGTLF